MNRLASAILSQKAELKKQRATISGNITLPIGNIEEFTMKILVLKMTNNILNKRETL
jgi:hypothetical protein